MGIRMPNRREFLQTGAAVSALAIHGLRPPSAAALSAAPVALALHKAIYDDRYDEGRRFAATAGAYGVPLRALDAGDITRFWYGELDPLWRREPVAIAGLTQLGPLFVVEQLAAERRLRVALRVEHRSAVDGSLEHVAEGPSATLARVTELRDAGLEWPELMAVLACLASSDASSATRAKFTTPGPAATLAAAAPTEPSVIHYYTPHAVQQGYGPALDGPLVSWVAAPRARGSRG
jgi:hypothetical protein